MAKVLFVGDVHGNFDVLNQLIRYHIKENDIDMVVQVGDFDYTPSDPNSRGDFDNFEIPCYFIRGNHEEHSAIPLDSLIEPTLLHSKYAPFKYVPDGFFMEDLGMLFVGGAWSIDIDREHRNHVNDQHFAETGHLWPYRWSPDEEIADSKFEEIYTFAKENAKDIRYLVSHDGPFAAYPFLCNPNYGPVVKTKTAVYLNHIMDSLTGCTNIFGHHHPYSIKTFDHLTSNKLICLPKLDAFRNNEHFYRTCTLIIDTESPYAY